MDTWNTITQSGRTRLKQALSVLETLCKEENISVMELLRSRERMTLAELYATTGEPPATLERRLESLCDTGCVIMEAVTLGMSYRLNAEKIRQINGFSRKLCQIPEGAMQHLAAN